jgi:hypothetical protein
MYIIKSYDMVQTIVNCFVKNKKKDRYQIHCFILVKGHLLMNYKYFGFMQIGKHPLDNFGLMDFQMNNIYYK